MSIKKMLQEYIQGGNELEVLQPSYHDTLIDGECMIICCDDDSATGIRARITVLGDGFDEEYVVKVKTMDLLAWVYGRTI